jgi:hypothetical protein
MTAGRSDADLLRGVVVTAGLVWSALFVVIGLHYELQLYGDGALFSYAVAVQDAWAFHWHNISGRLTVYLLTLLPAEIYVGLTGDPAGGIAVYGLLFFAAPLAGLIATFALDRTPGRVIFAGACFSTACLCPLVFGFPTEMWIAHTLFWPALAAAHRNRDTGGAILLFLLLLFLLLLLLVLCHEGALVLAAAIVISLLPRGLADRLFQSAAGALMAAVSIWAGVKLALRPDAYFSEVLVRAGSSFFDIDVFTGHLDILLLATVGSYAVVFLALARIAPKRAHIYAAALIAAGLAAYWWHAGAPLHAADRYYLRTVLVIVTPILGLGAALFALQAGNHPHPRLPIPPGVMRTLTGGMGARALIGAFVLVMLIHAVTTEKFVVAWSNHKSAVAALAAGTASDPELGDARLVSSARLSADPGRLAWFSTMPYLSVILAKFAPSRLVVDPRRENYFWLSCEAATTNHHANRAVPAATRDLVRVHACLHR